MRRLLLSLAVVLLGVGAVFGTGAGDIIADDETVTLDDGVILEPADTPEGNTYVNGSSGEEITVEVGNLPNNATTQIDDLVRVSFDDANATQARIYVRDGGNENVQITATTADDSVSFLAAESPATPLRVPVEGRNNAVVIPATEGGDDASVLLGAEVDATDSSVSSVVLQNLTFVAEIPADFSIDVFEPAETRATDGSVTVVEGQNISLQSTTSNVDTVDADRQFELVETTGESARTVETISSRSLAAGSSGLTEFTVPTTQVDSATDRRFTLFVNDTRIASRDPANLARQIDDRANTSVTVRPAALNLALNSSDAFGDPDIVKIEFTAQETFLVENFEYELELLSAANASRTSREGSLANVTVGELEQTDSQSGVIEIDSDVDAKLIDGEYRVTGTLDEGGSGDGTATASTTFTIDSVDEGGSGDGTATAGTTFTIDSEIPSINTTLVRDVGSTQQPVAFDVALESDDPGSGTVQIRDGGENGSVVSGENGSVVFERNVTDAYSGSETVRWDTTGQDGTAVDDGEYTVVVTATNSVGDESTRTRTVEVDNNPPVVENVELEDDAGNTVTDTANSSIITDTVDENGTVELDPSGVGLDTSVNTTEAAGDTVNAEFTQTQAPPANTQPNPTQATGDGFIDADLSVPAEQVEKATVEIPVDGQVASVPGFETDELRIIRSQEGESSFEPVPTTVEDGALTATVSGFGQFAVAGTADDPPMVTVSSVEQTIERDGEVTKTVRFDYEPADSAISNIDIGETELTASVDESQVTRQMNATRGQVIVRDTAPTETVRVSADVIDTRGNTETATVTVNPPTRELSASDPDRSSSEVTTLTVEPADTTVQRIDFTGETVLDTVSVTYLDALPATAPALDDRPFVTGFETQTAAENTAPAATVEVTVSAAELDDSGAVPTDIVVRRVTDDGYQTVETSVVDTGDDITVSAATQRLGVFVVTTAAETTDLREGGESEGPTETPAVRGEIRQPADETEMSGDTAADQKIAGWWFLVALLALLIVVLVILVIAWRNSTDESVDDVTVTYLDAMPATAPALNDRPFVTGFETQAAAENVDPAATVEVTVPAAELDDSGAVPADIVVRRVTDDDYQTVETSVVDTGDDITVSAATRHLGVFVVTTAAETTDLREGDDSEGGRN